jgi:hypothetical protein
MMMQIQAKPFTSLAEYQREAKARARRLWATGSVEKAVGPVVVQFADHSRPWAPTVAVREREEPDAHIRTWEAWLVAPDHSILPRGYILGRCRQEGVKLSTLRSAKRHRSLVEFRHKLIKEVAERYPHLSSPQLGRLFNRDHSSILSVLGHLRSKDEQAQRAAERKIANADRKAAAEAKRRLRKKRATNRYSVPAVIDDYYSGMMIDDICEHHGIGRRTIAGIRKKYGLAVRKRA